MPDGIDPNILIGWFIFGGIVLGALWKAGRWISKLIVVGQSIIEEMGALRHDVNAIQSSLTGYRVALAYVLAKLGEPLDKLDELVEKGREQT